MIRRKVTWMFLVAVLSVLLPAFVVQGLAQGSPAAATSENDGGKCSLATLKGSYGVLEQGTVVGQIPGFPPPPWPAVNSVLATYDGAGNVSGTYTASFGGVIVPGTFAGTYKVKRDCTYLMEFTALPLGVVLHETGTITGRGMFREIHLMYTDPILVASGTAKKTPPGGCSVETVEGTYAHFGQGTITMQIPGFPPPPVLDVHSGVVTFDGEGGFSGHDTSSIDGVVVPDTFTGTSTVNPDCTTSSVINTSLGLILHEAGTITGARPFQEYHGIITDAGWVFADTLKKQ